MITAAMNAEKPTGRFRDPAVLRRALEQEARSTLCYDHFEHGLHGSILNSQHVSDLKLALLFRHPADSLISQYHFLQNKIKTGLIDRQPFESLEEYIGHRLRGHHYRQYIWERIVAWHQDPGVFRVRYEDLVEDTTASLARILLFYEIPCDSKTMADIVDRHRFEVLSGGRRPGEEDPDSHYRKGLRDQWIETLTGGQRRLIQANIGDYLITLGYDI